MFMILFDVFVQLTLFTSLYLFYFISSEETFTQLFQFFGMVDKQSTQINNFLCLQLPTLLIIWVKTLAGLRAWFLEDFSRKSIESYFIYSFVYHTYTIITNTLMFSL
jgi:hypothetical protein